MAMFGTRALQSWRAVMLPSGYTFETFSLQLCLLACSMCFCGVYTVYCRILMNTAVTHMLYTPISIRSMNLTGRVKKVATVQISSAY